MIRLLYRYMNLRALADVGSLRAISIGSDLCNGSDRGIIGRRSYRATIVYCYIYILGACFVTIATSPRSYRLVAALLAVR